MLKRGAVGVAGGRAASTEGSGIRPAPLRRVIAANGTEAIGRRRWTARRPRQRSLTGGAGRRGGGGDDVRVGWLDPLRLGAALARGGGDSQGRCGVVPDFSGAEADTRFFVPGGEGGDGGGGVWVEAVGFAADGGAGGGVMDGVDFDGGGEAEAHILCVTGWASDGLGISRGGFETRFWCLCSWERVAGENRGKEREEREVIF